MLRDQRSGGKIADDADRLLRIDKGAANHDSNKCGLGQNELEKRMKLSTKSLLLGPVMALGACTGMPMPTAGNAPDPVSTSIPQEVRDIAAPFQDLNTAVLLEQDNCYWYQHQGPVETTLLPLRSVRGAPICGPAPEAIPTPAPAV
ncbi:MULTISPECIES: hypothetical protein [unclassified Yoonia]|uniref:hypothetical protein n=1 Tax=unclassified Yoonia TaxID=2629118 RepID=UPI002AFEA2C8|nr:MULTISPECIES: hypothetical protein [unclassified Yoonia]